MKKKRTEDKNIIEVKEETQVGDYILEAGDKVEVLNEETDVQEQIYLALTKSNSEAEAGEKIARMLAPIIGGEANKSGFNSGKVIRSLGNSLSGM